MQLLTNKTFENEDVRKVTTLIKKFIIEGQKQDNFSL